MSLRSLLSTLREKWSGRVPSRRRLTKPLRSRLTLEALEARIVPATPPTIVSFTPANGSTVGGTATNPTLSITFSEAMDAVDVQNTANYTLFNSEGQAVPINTATYTAATDTVTLTYDVVNNVQQILPADTYSLYIRGDTVHDSTDTYTLANPGQIVVANTGTSTVSTLNTSTDPNTNLLNSIQSYPVTAPLGSAKVAVPVGVAVADFNLDGLKDVAVLNSGTNEIDIYLGTASGIYNSSPSMRIALPAGSEPRALLSAAFNPTLPAVQDLAVLDGTGKVDVYVNTSTPGALSFAPVGIYAAGVAPTAFAVADLNGLGVPDIVVVDPTPISNGATPPVFNFFAYILPGTGTGTFGGATAIQVGTEGLAGSLQFPDLVGAGNLGEDPPAGTVPTTPARAASWWAAPTACRLKSTKGRGRSRSTAPPRAFSGPTTPPRSSWRRSTRVTAVSAGTRGTLSPLTRPSAKTTPPFVSFRRVGTMRRPSPSPRRKTSTTSSRRT